MLTEISGSIYRLGLFPKIARENCKRFPSFCLAICVLHPLDRLSFQTVPARARADHPGPRMLGVRDRGLSQQLDQLERYKKTLHPTTHRVTQTWRLQKRNKEVLNASDSIISMTAIKRAIITRKVDRQLQSRIRRHVPKDSFLIYNCVPCKLKRHSFLKPMPTFAIFSTLQSLPLQFTTPPYHQMWPQCESMRGCSRVYWKFLVTKFETA